MKKQTKKEDESIQLALDIAKLVAGRKMKVILDALDRLHYGILQAGFEDFLKSSYPKS